jgi:hypothetical protein
MIPYHTLELRGGTINLGVFRDRESEVLAEQQPQHGVFDCDHAGLAINMISLGDELFGLIPVGGT